MLFKLVECNTAVIFGAGHGIGLALVEELLIKYPEIKIYASYRKINKADNLLSLAAKYPNRLKAHKLDPLDEAKLAEFVAMIKSKEKKVELIINSIGTLHDENVQPEKSLNQISQQGLLHYFSINSIITPILAKHFLPLLRHKSASLFVSISAKVGSITDNQLGGWYGYRASKSALNMFVKTIGLELKRRGCSTLTIALHPGTTITELSQPFIAKTSYQLHSSNETASNLIKVIREQDINNAEQFLSWTGEALPW